ncbi:gas vesicle protein GvpG [Candidatus Formimonas warabiya]|uniref:Gas vesicle protein GvpG n=1 Tax=Formimonas warabiya TaxID=1761012 RepID=A0A3G1KWV2_FORW1|nr:gas vesicle protein GvpG [Candidatus Formimonas warabiya]ATW26954.1 hypothetical protein DCMF_21275 [Candidatus Formimonas warabiya]
MLIIDDILLFPYRGLKFIFNQILDHLDQEYNSVDAVKKELSELQLRFEMDEISEEEYDQAEAVLLVRLKEIRERGKTDEDQDEDDEDDDEENEDDDDE